MDGTQLLKGVLDVCVLRVLDAEQTYGYDVVRRLRAAGLEEVAEASVYGTLRRLYRAGHVNSWMLPSDGGPPRRCYGLTTSGRDALNAGVKTWIQFRDVVDDMLGEGT